MRLGFGLVIHAGVRADTLKALPTLRTPPNRHLLPWHPVRTPPSQVLAQRVPDLALLREEQGVSDGDEISARFLNLWTGRTPP